jgi:hypothetical protein
MRHRYNVIQAGDFISDQSKYLPLMLTSAYKLNYYIYHASKLWRPAPGTNTNTINSRPFAIVFGLLECSNLEQIK